MIPTLVRIYWTSLRRDRVAQAMTFLLPVMFFSIFALVFGQRGRGGLQRVPVAIADLDRSETSQRLIRALQREPSMLVRTRSRPVGAPKDAAETPLDLERARTLVHDGDVPVAFVMPAGFESAFGHFDRGGVRITMFTDPSDPIAPRVAAGLLQKVSMTALPEVLASRGIGQFERHAGALTPQQRAVVDHWLPELKAWSLADSGGAAADSAGDRKAAGLAAEMIGVDEVQVLGEKRDNGMVSFYAAGIAVMFLLFSASSAGGALLDEVESGTLDRVLTSNVGMTGLLAGKWLYIILLGTLQITVMFLWGRLVFGLDLFHHLPGFAVMIVITAATAAAFGLVLATLCRTRQQLGGIATIVILAISAVGGSMFPRYLMSAGMQHMGLLTFNAWALDGFVKVFWRNARIVDLAPQIAVLMAFMAAFLTAARLLARRWERS